jgi:hypothetical protein
VTKRARTPISACPPQSVLEAVSTSMAIERRRKGNRIPRVLASIQDTVYYESNQIMCTHAAPVEVARPRDVFGSIVLKMSWAPRRRVYSNAIPGHDLQASKPVGSASAKVAARQADSALRPCSENLSPSSRCGWRQIFRCPVAIATPSDPE